MATPRPVGVARVGFCARQEHLGDGPRVRLPGAVRRPRPVAIEHPLRAVEEWPHVARAPIGSLPARNYRLGGDEKQPDGREAAIGRADAHEGAQRGREAAALVVGHGIGGRESSGRSQPGGVSGDGLLQKLNVVHSGRQPATLVSQEPQLAGRVAKRKAQVGRRARGASDAELGAALREARRGRWVAPIRGGGRRKLQHAAHGVGGRRAVRDAGVLGQVNAVQHDAILQIGALRCLWRARRHAARSAGRNPHRRAGGEAQRRPDPAPSVLEHHVAPLVGGDGAAKAVDRRLENISERAARRVVIKHEARAVAGSHGGGELPSIPGGAAAAGGAAASARRRSS